MEKGADLGYLEIQNNTLYNILVYIRGHQGSYGPYKIKGDPSFIRLDLENEKYRVIVFVCTPTADQTPVFYKVYVVDVLPDYKTTTVTVTAPLGYIPVPVNKTPFSIAPEGGEK